MNCTCQGQGGRDRSAKGGLAGGPGAQKAVKTFVSLMFFSFRGQNGVGRRLGLWLPWLAGGLRLRKTGKVPKCWKLKNVKWEIKCICGGSKTDQHRAWDIPK